MHARSARARFCVLLVAFTGCITSAPIRPSSLSKLDGFDLATPDGKTRELKGVKGGTVEYCKGRSLTFTKPDGGNTGGAFKRINVLNGQLVGTLVGGTSLTLDPEILLSPRVEHVSAGKTIGLILGLLGGGVAAFYGIAALVIAAGGGLRFGLGF